MNLNMLPSDDTHCIQTANSATHPYYVVASGYQKAGPANRMLHHLCSWLNHAGHESWMITTDANAHLWTPKLNDHARAQHHSAKKCPIIVFADVKLANSTQIGIKVRYQFDVMSMASDIDSTPTALSFAWASANEDMRLRLPFLDLTRPPVGEVQRVDSLVYSEKYLAAGGSKQDLPADAIRLTETDMQDEASLLDRLGRSRKLYLYEPHVLSAKARAQGCEVVHVHTDRVWPIGNKQRSALGDLGSVETTNWTDSPKVAPWHASAFLEQYRLQMSGWKGDLNAFMSRTQLAADQQPWSEVWPEDVVLALPPTDVTLQAAAWRADRIKQLRSNKQLAQWNDRSTLREIDGEIYGDYVVSGALPALAAVVYADHDMDALADTLDSLSNSLLPPSELTIVSGLPSPFGDTQDAGLRWVQLPPEWVDLLELPHHSSEPLTHIQAPWVLAMKAGATLASNATLEFAITAKHTAASVLYADEDILMEGKHQYPHFKPHTNMEWLRSTNYLGDAVVVQARGWKKHSQRHHFEGVYAFALRTLETRGRAGLKHIDTLLVHGTGKVSDAQLAMERIQVEAHLVKTGLQAVVSSNNQRGLRNIAYAAGGHNVSMVVPCATQVGYLGCLLQSLAGHLSSLLHEVLVVADTEFANRVQQAVDEVHTPFQTRVITIDNRPYSHAKALNRGAAEATGNLLLFADDDTEVVHANWLEPLCGLFNQSDIAAVAPRLVRPGSPDPVMVAGPAFLGLAGLYASYCGENGNVLESGPYGRLQATQDVSAFAPHFFLTSAQHFKMLGGFDEAELPFLLPVLDFAIKASSQGLRHVWSPQVSVLHHGGKTMEERQRLPEDLLALRQAELRERRCLAARWTSALGADPNYNRNLSLGQPFDLEQDIVIDWQPSRQDKPRTVALPLSSGSGQYRVVEPLNALQDKGKAQSCVVFPINRDVIRVPTSIELVRSGLDRLIVQNAIGDLHLARLEEYRLNLPKLGVIHMLDDLFGNLPGKHYLHNFHKREGNTRLRRSLELSDRLVVTTQPLKEYYEAFIAETRVVPNSLVESTWFDLPVTKRERTGKLRVGWAGAQQHLGDLDMIQTVVAHFGNKVDWVFMGMCPPSIQPHVKEVHPFVSINVYPQTLANLDLDIAIAPLEDNHFNTCKSNLRLLEYGAMGWPVVCSDVYPFRTDDPPVRRVSNDAGEWIAALDALIASDTLRNDMGKQLNHWVKTRYALSVHTDAWFKAIFDPINR